MQVPSPWKKHCRSPGERAEVSAENAVGTGAVPALSEEQRAHLAARLGMRTSNQTDHGQLLPHTASALAKESWWERCEALAHALLSERLVVPIDVEADPRVTGHHSERAGTVETDWATVDTPHGPALVAYTSAAQLQAAVPGARPTTLAARTVALTSLVETGGRVHIDPAGVALTLPKPATTAIASGDRWLPAWKDVDLQAELDRIAVGFPVVTDVSIEANQSGGFVLVVGINAGGLDDPTALQETVTQALGALAVCPRLIAATGPLEIRPVRR